MRIVLSLVIVALPWALLFGAMFMVRDLEAIAVNTNARLDNYLKSNKLLSGHTF